MKVDSLPQTVPRNNPTRRDFLQGTACVTVAGLFATPAPAVSPGAATVHRNAYVFDGRVHALDRKFQHGGDITDRVETGQWDLARAIEGGVNAFSLCLCARGVLPRSV